MASAAQDTQDAPGPPRPYAVGDADDRPWGRWEVLAVGPYYVVKRISINPGQQISLQRHQHRDEHWTIVAGDGWAHVRGRCLSAIAGSTFVVRAGEVHRLSAGDAGLALIEVQTGECSEDDIERLADDYDRA